MLIKVTLHFQSMIQSKSEDYQMYRMKMVELFL